MRVLAHRGLVDPSRPENTLAAVTAALDAGADGVEVDVRLTADGVLALSHDDDLGRVAGVRLPISRTPWTVLEEAAGAQGLRLARAGEVLLAAAGRRVVLEAKPAPPGAAAQRTARALTAQLVALRRTGLLLDVTVSSFSPGLLGHVRRLLPADLGVRTALLGGPLVRPSSLVRQALREGHDEVHPHVGALLRSPRSVAQAHGTGLLVVPWTVNADRDVLRLSRLGVDGVITDVPREVARTLVATSVRQAS